MDASDDSATVLRDACEVWQSGRDGGSTPIRAAARLLTRTDHYFRADFISDAEEKARCDERALARAGALLDELANRPIESAGRWAAALSVDSEWVGRGIRGGPQDDQILSTLESGVLEMPLWGMSVDRAVAHSFGTGFLFQIRGPFSAIPAAVSSGVKAEERELITGGRYAVDDVSRGGDGWLVSVRFVEPILRRVDWDQ